MRNNLSLLIVMGLLVASGGCKPKEQQTRQALNEAVETIELAHRGFVPPQAETDRLAVYRRRQYEQARGDLQQIIATTEGPMAVTARQLQASIDLALARQLGQEATRSVGNLSDRASGLLSRLNNTRRAASRSRGLNSDRAAALNRLQKAIRKQEQRKSDLQQQVGRYEQQISPLQHKQSNLREQASQAFAKSQQLRGKAFQAEGDRHYDMLDQAAEAKRRSQKLSARADRLRLQIDQLKSKRTVARSELEAVNQALKDLTARVQQNQTAQQQEKDLRKQARQQWEQSAQQLAETIQQVVQQYRKQVAPALDKALQRADRAVSQLKQAREQATGADQRRDIRADLLAARLERVKLLSAQAAAARNLSQTVNLVVQEADSLAPNQASRMKKVRRTLEQRQQKIVEKARQAVERTRDLAGRLAEGSGEIARTAESSRQLLQVYQQRITPGSDESPAGENPQSNPRPKQSALHGPDSPAIGEV